MSEIEEQLKDPMRGFQDFDWLMPNLLMGNMPGFETVATSLMKKTLKNKGVATIEELCSICLDSGVNLIDTAASYYGSEEMIGKTVGHRRDEFILVSKCGGEFDEFDDPAWSPAVITKTIDRSLQRLKTDRLDVMLLHTCDLETLHFYSKP